VTALLAGFSHAALVEKPKAPISRKAMVGMYWFRSIADLYTAIDQLLQGELGHPWSAATPPADLPTV